MAISPTKPLDFRAPPPSPIASGRRSSVTNEETLSNFLQHSLHVPTLILPEKAFPTQKFIQNPPKIDFQKLHNSISIILESIATIGCFQVVNYGVPSEIIKSTVATAAGVFELSKEKRSTVVRSPEKVYGFEEGDEDGSEEFVWCDDEGLRKDMEGIWPLGYSKFSDKMEYLSIQIQKLCSKIIQILKDHSNPNLVNKKENEDITPVCYIYKNGQNAISEDHRANALRYDVIRMVIRGVDVPHWLSVHVFDGASEFHVYSKKGWVSFCPDRDAIVVTVGDQLQAMSEGQYKHVMGRPIFEEESIALAFLYSPPNILEDEKAISLHHQLLLAIFFTLLYHFFAYYYNFF